MTKLRDLSEEEFEEAFGGQAWWKNFKDQSSHFAVTRKSLERPNVSIRRHSVMTAFEAALTKEGLGELTEHYLRIALVEALDDQVQARQGEKVLDSLGKKNRRK